MAVCPRHLPFTFQNFKFIVTSFARLVNRRGNGKWKVRGTKTEKANSAHKACLKIGDVPSGEEFWAAGKQFFRRDLTDFKEKLRRPNLIKTRRLGMLTFFRTSP